MRRTQGNVNSELNDEQSHRGQLQYHPHLQHQLSWVAAVLKQSRCNLSQEAWRFCDVLRGMQNSRTQGNRRRNRRSVQHDEEPARVIHFSASPTSCIISLARFSTSRAGTPRSKAKVRKCSITVSSDHNTSCCGQTPMRRRISVMSVRIEWPAIVASPALGVTMPVSMLMVVDFPAPLWPSKAKISPRHGTHPQSQGANGGHQCGGKGA